MTTKRVLVLFILMIVIGTLHHTSFIVILISIKQVSSCIEITAAINSHSTPQLNQLLNSVTAPLTCSAL